MNYSLAAYFHLLSHVLHSLKPGKYTFESILLTSSVAFNQSDSERIDLFLDKPKCCCCPPGIIFFSYTTHSETGGWEATGSKEAALTGRKKFNLKSQLQSSFSLLKIFSTKDSTVICFFLPTIWRED